MGILETLIETLKEERDRRKRARITKEWFRNDIREIRKQLRDDTIGAFNTWSNNKPLDAYRVYYRTVFEKLINQLGDIGDEGLVSGIVAFLLEIAGGSMWPGRASLASSRIQPTEARRLRETLGPKLVRECEA